jgi:glycosyltransferase involved in cell wall biosynthesis
MVGVHFRGIVLGPSGFAAQGREWLAALEAAELAPALEGARLGEREAPLDADERALIERCAARAPVPGGITVHHLLVPHYAPDPRAASNVLLTLFEADGLPPGWRETLARADLVVVPSEWNRAAFAAAGVEHTVTLPPPFATGPFDPRRTPRRRPHARDGERLRWLSVFDWSLRKGPDLLLEAFARAFDAAQAELLLKVPPQPGGARALQAHCERELRRAARGAPPRVVVNDAELDRAALARLYADADAFVLASRGEGWGRPVHEALLMELPVVAPQHTALAELVADASCGFPVAARACEVAAAAAAEVPWYRGLRWHEPDVDDLCARLREVAADPAAARNRARTGRQRLRALCAPARIAQRLRALVEAAPRPAAPSTGLLAHR